MLLLTEPIPTAAARYSNSHASLSHFFTHFLSSFVTKLIHTPFLCFLFLKSILLTCPRHHLPGFLKLVRVCSVRALHLFFISAQCGCSNLEHFMEANEWEMCPYPSVWEFIYNFLWKCLRVSHNAFLMNELFLQKTGNIGFCYQQGLEKAQLFGSWAKPRQWLFLYHYVHFSVDLINMFP